LVRVKTLWRLIGGGGSVGAHNRVNASGQRSTEFDSSGNSPAGVVSAVLCAVEFTNASGKGLEQLA
jgi:hypothetical protein